MFPNIVLFDKYTIPLYGPVFFVGVVIAFLIALKMAPKYNVGKEDLLFCTVYAAIGLFIGAKVLFFISKLPNIISNFDLYIKFIKVDWMAALNYAFGGLVFYGGLIGTVIGAYRYCYHFKLPFVPYVDIFAPLIPLVHGFGRIGCFLGGCCYGIEYYGFGSIQFPYNEYVQSLDDVPRFPVQLLEAGMNFVFSGILLFMLKKKKFKPGQTMGIYLIYYTIARFLLELLRGDKARGVWGFLSTSQIISLLLIPLGIILIRGKWLSEWDAKRMEKVQAEQLKKESK